MKKFFLIVFVALLTNSLSLSAQGSVALGSYSPYTLFGIGDLVTQGTPYNKSMAGVGIGVRDNRYINFLNPAAASSIDTLSFMVDFGVQQKNTIYTGMGTTGGLGENEVLKNAYNIFNMSHIAISFPLYRSSAMVLGITPLSDVGYSFAESETDDALVAELGDIQYQKMGTGGLYSAFAGASATFWKRVSVGAQAHFNFGTISRSSYAIFNSTSSQRTIQSGWQYALRGVTAKFGLQYAQPLGEQHFMIIGGTYKLPCNLGGVSTRYAYALSSSYTDTVRHNEVINGNIINMPEEIGVGISFKSSAKWQVAFDYTLQDWSNTKFEETPGIDFQTTKAQSFKLGFEFTPNRYDIRYYFKRVSYRFGVYHNQSYYTLNGSQISATGITFGLSLPVFRFYNSITLGVDLGERGSLKNDLVRERYANFYIGINLHDIWFQKPLYK